jgi:hypothetical protein
VTVVVASNIDFLQWFTEDERQLCGYCRERASVTLPDAHASFCLHCGAVTVDGVRVDVDRRFDQL